MSVGLQRLREEPDVIRDGAVRKGEDPALVDRALELDTERRRLLAEAETLKAERNAASKQIGEAIKAGAAPDGPEVADLRAASTEAGTRITVLDAAVAETEAALDDALLRIPNPPDPDIPVGGEEANVTIRVWGEQLPRDQPLQGEVGADAPRAVRPGRASRTGSSARRSTSSTTPAARRSRAPASRSTRAPDRRSSAGSSTGSSTSTPARTG